MKKYKFTAALLAFLAAAQLTSAATVFADEPETAISAVELKKYLVMDSDTRVPNADFQFTLTSGEAIQGTETTRPVFAGPENAAFAASEDVSVSGNTATVSFSASDTATPENQAPDGSTIGFATTDNHTDEQFVEKTLSIDLSGVTFPEVGIYRYVVTETPSSAAGITNDTTLTRYVDVYVHKTEQDSQDVFIPVAAVVRTTPAVPDINGETSTSIKSTGFTNRYTAHSLSFSKAVTGNQASANQYFKFTVQITDDAAEGDADVLIAVDGTYQAEPATNMATIYESVDMAAANSTELTTAGGEKFVTLAQLKEGKVFYIRDGQSITLSGIPDGMGYRVAEAAEDYTPSVAVTGDEAEISENTVTDTALEGDASLAFINQRDSILPDTGVTVRLLLPLAVMIAGVAAIVIIVIRKKRYA